MAIVDGELPNRNPQNLLPFYFHFVSTFPPSLPSKKIPEESCLIRYSLCNRFSEENVWNVSPNSNTRPASIINKEHIPAREEEIGERKFPCNVTISVHADSTCGACAPAIEHVRHIEERKKWGNIPLDTSRSVHGLDVYSLLSLLSNHRNEIRGSITFNRTNIFSFRSHRIAWPRSSHSWPWSAILIFSGTFCRVSDRSKPRSS